MSDLKALTAELQKIAVEELNEVPSRIPEDLEAFREWILTQPHLKARTNDQFLIQFLRGCKYSLERAKEKLDLYYSHKSKYPDMLNAINVDDVKFRTISRLGCFAAIPDPLHGNGPRVVAFQFNFSTSQYSVDEIFQPWSAYHEYLMVNDPYACLHGLMYIIDFKKATASHFLQMTPNFAKKLVTFLEKTMPLRIKGIYYVNTSAAAQQFFRILFPFLSEKLKERIKVMGNNYDELQKDIPCKYLFHDYGGSQSSIMDIAQELDKVWDANRDFFKANVEYGTVEELRPGKPLDLDGLFGVGGSFRKIVVD